MSTIHFHNHGPAEGLTVPPHQFPVLLVKGLNCSLSLSLSIYLSIYLSLSVSIISFFVSFFVSADGSATDADGSDANAPSTSADGPPNAAETPGAGSPHARTDATGGQAAANYPLASWVFLSPLLSSRLACGFVLLSLLLVAYCLSLLFSCVSFFFFCLLLRFICFRACPSTLTICSRACLSPCNRWRPWPLLHLPHVSFVSCSREREREGTDSSACVRFSHPPRLVVSDA